MTEFSNRDIADYYNQTLIHYKRWWKLEKYLSVHYGVWDNTTNNFAEALLNTNKVMMEIANVKEDDHVLDAGCGVGGSGVFLATNKKAKVSGVTLSEKQYDFALKISNKLNLNHLLDFKLEDYSKTSYPNNHFNFIWCIESITSASDKELFAREAFRLLKPGGKLIIADYFNTSQKKGDPKNYLDNWRKIWNMAPIESMDDYVPKFTAADFSLTENHNFTKEIFPTAKRMYYSYLFGALPAITYNMLYKNVSRFGKTNYKSGYYQYKALKKGLWEYRILLFKKSSD